MSRPWMPLYVGDYLVDTLDLRAEESGVYLLMLMLAWRRPDGAIPNDMKWLQRALASCASDMHGNRFNKVVPPLLERFFALGEDGKFRNKRLTKEREKAEKFSGKQKENAEKRWGAVKENNDLSDANAMPAHAEQSQSQSQPEKKETREVALTSADPSDFDAFWDEWPNKVGKPAALKAFNSAIKRGAGLWDIQDGLRNYIRDKPPDRPWLNPATFLNQNRWEDQPATVQGSSNGRRTVHDAANDLLERVQALDEPAPGGIRGGTFQGPLRLLPPR